MELIERLMELYRINGSTYRKVSLVHSDHITISDKVKDKIQMKACFYNAEIATKNGDDIDYVIGFMNLDDIGLPIEHAWNAKGDQYFDLTSDYCLNNNDLKSSYYELFRIDKETLIKMTKNENEGYIDLFSFVSFQND